MTGNAIYSADTYPELHRLPMTARQQLLAIDDKLADLHTLIILLQSRDPNKYPLPGNADELLDECEAQLNQARDELKALATVEEKN